MSATVLPILLGFAMARPVIEAPSIQAYKLLNAGLAEQRAGHAVAAEEDYAVVLSLYPSNEFARYDLGVLDQEAGRTNEAMSLYAGVLREDPNFTPAKQNMEYLLHTRFGFSNLHRR